MAAGTGTQKELCVQIVDLQPDLPAVRALELNAFRMHGRRSFTGSADEQLDKAWVLKRMKPSVATAPFASLARRRADADRGSRRVPGRGYGRLDERLLRKQRRKTSRISP